MTSCFVIIVELVLAADDIEDIEFDRLWQLRSDELSETTFDKAFSFDSLSALKHRYMKTN